MKDEKMKVKAILIDLDGTIFDITERDAFARYKALSDLGYDISLEAVRRYYHFGAGRLGPVKELGIEFTKEKEKEYIKASFAHFVEREASRLTKIHKGAHDVLSALAKRFRLAVVTSRETLSSTEEELGDFDIRRFFSLIVTREVAAEYYGVEKIPLLPFHEQRKKLYECAIGLTEADPGDMLCIGDSVEELQPAKELGIKVIGVLTGFSNKEDMEKASIPTISDFSQLIKMIDRSS